MVHHGATMAEPSKEREETVKRSIAETLDRELLRNSHRSYLISYLIASRLVYI